MEVRAPGPQDAWRVRAGTGPVGWVTPGKVFLAPVEGLSPGETESGQECHRSWRPIYMEGKFWKSTPWLSSLVREASGTKSKHRKKGTAGCGKQHEANRYQMGDFQRKCVPSGART